MTLKVLSKVLFIVLICAIIASAFAGWTWDESVIRVVAGFADGPLGLGVVDAF